MTSLCLTLYFNVNSANAELALLSDRTDFHLRPLVEQFSEQTGIKVRSAFVEAGTLVPRALATSPDLLVTTDTTSLVQIQKQGKLQPLNLPNVAVPAEYRTPYFVALSYRVRGVVVSRELKTPITDYLSLVDGQFKICVRPLTHTYNLSLLAQMLEDYPYGTVKQWLINLKANLGLSPSGNDRKQAEFVSQGKCDVGIMNSYYYGLLLANPSTREMAKLLTLKYPQGPHGSYTLVSGAGTMSDNPDAVKFVEFLLSEQAQRFMANTTYEYPVMIEPPLSLRMLPKTKVHLNVSPNLEHRDEAVRLLLEVGI